LNLIHRAKRQMPSLAAFHGRSRHRLLILIAASAACGRQEGLRTSNADAAQGGNRMPSGGAGGAAFHDGSVGATGGVGGTTSQGTGGIWISIGGVSGSGDGGSGGGGARQDVSVADAEIMLLPDGACGDEYPLWQAIASGPGIGYCFRPGDGGVEEWHVVLDGDGRVVDNSFFGCDSDGGCNPARLQNWLASLAGYRWPCLASQTIGYDCVVM
jgi:hypothetical protein